MNVRRHREFLGLALLVVLMCAPSAMAQTVTGAITGHALDEGGLSLPGTTVTITSPAMIGGARTAVTDNQGEYRFTLLVPGTYRVSFMVPGFTTLNVDTVAVGAGATMTINGTLKLGVLSEELTVTSDAPTIDLQAATVGVNWSKQNMETLPWGKSLPSLVGMIPGLYSTQYDVGASTMGGTAAPPSRTYGKTGGNVVMYDGVVYDQFFGDFGSYDEIQITSAAKGAEASSSGASFNFIIKSGGNQFHGSGLTAWQGASLQSNNVNQQLLDRGLPATSNKYTHYRDVKGDFGGRILVDKLWFYGAYTDSYTGQYVSGFVSERSGGQPEVFYTRLFGPTTRLTYQLAKKMKLDYVQQIARKWQPYRGADQFTTLEATGSQSYWGEIASGKWMYFPSSSLTADLAINRAGTWNRNGSWTDANRRQDLTTTQTRGAAATSHGAPRRWQYNGSISWFPELAGRHHELKTGFLDFRDTTNNISEGYPDQQLYRYRSATGDSDVFARPDSVQVFSYPVNTALGINYHSWYANDKINVTRKLTFNVGVRYDRYSSWLPEQGNPGTGPFSTKILYPERHDFPVYNNWSPRVSAAYDVFGNGRFAIKASYGSYAGATSGSSPSPGPSASSVNPAAVITTTYNNWDGTIPYVPVPANLASTTGGGGTQRLDTNLTAPITNEYTIGTEFGTRTYLMRLNVVRKIDKGGNKTLDLAMPYAAYTDLATAVDPGVDNVVGTADDGVMYAWSVPRSYPGFGQVNKLITNLADGEGGAKYTAYEATFNKQYSKGWSFLASGTMDVGRTVNPNPLSLTPNDLMYNWSFQKRNYSVKVNGSYQFPLGISFSSSYNAQSGEYYSRSAQMRNALNTLVTVVVQGNAGRYDWVRLWDNRFTKSFTVGKGRSLQASLDIYNTLNASTVLAQVNTNGPNYLKPSAASMVAATATAILPPRILRIGMRYTF
jgi:Carboxypeptidase regulatory-like domain